MGTKNNLFVTLAIASVTAVTTLISSQSGAGVLSGPKPMVLAANAPSSHAFASYTEVPRSLAPAKTNTHWAAGSAIDSDIGHMRAGSNQSNWTYVPRHPLSSRRARAGTVTLGEYKKFQEMGRTSFDRETALVVMHTDDSWQQSGKIFGRQFRSELTAWSGLKTGWTEPQASEVQTEWRPVRKPGSKYRTVSEFCSHDISKEFGSEKGCTRYSQSIASVLQVMDNFINWIKDLWWDDRRRA